MLLLFFKEHPSHSVGLDISVELSPFAVKSMFWLRSGPITSQEITYPDLVVARTEKGHDIFLSVLASGRRKQKFKYLFLVAFCFVYFYAFSLLVIV